MFVRCDECKRLVKRTNIAMKEEHWNFCNNCCWDDGNLTQIVEEEAKRLVNYLMERKEQWRKQLKR